jgi:hypothetical protein
MHATSLSEHSDVGTPKGIVSTVYPMNERVEHYQQVIGDDVVDGTILVVAGARIEEVRDVLLADAGVPEGEEVDEEEQSGYVLIEVSGGVLAVEDTGYADPTVAALERLSAGGRAAAVVTWDIQAHQRFGCARDGVLLFDDPEYVYLKADDRSRVPDELRPLFDLAWVDLTRDDDVEPELAPFVVGLAMAELVTGIALSADDLRRASDAPPDHWVPVRTLQYALELDARHEAG